MDEEEYRAEMAKQARIRNMIELRRLAGDNLSVMGLVGRLIGGEVLTQKIIMELGLE